MTETTNQPVFEINRIYTKDISFESPKAPAIFKKEIQFSVDVSLDSKSSALEEGFFEVVLAITVTAKDNANKDNVAYIAETKQAGIFTLKNFTDEQKNQILATVCANILFPYARETLSSVISRGGFPQLYLAPVNFDAIYAQQQNAAKSQNGAAVTTH